MSSKRTLSRGLCSLAALGAVLAAPAVHAASVRYRYVPLDQLQLPAPYTAFSPSVVVDGRVVGTVYDDDFTTVNVAVYDHGRVTIGPEGMAVTANEDGIVGGADLSSQAALFRRGGTTLVPRLPDELSASVIAFGRGDLALVESINSSARTYAYFRRGVETAIDFGLPDPVFGAFMNDAGVVAVTKQESPSDHFTHGYRYEPRSGKTTLLPPFAGDPTDTMVLVQGINRRGEILGYSYTNDYGANYHERIGLWDRDGVFQPYYYETINTSLALFNEHDQIVITNPLYMGPADFNSYLVPAPGVRIDLASLVANMPDGLFLTNVVSIDDEGNMVGNATDADYANIYPFMLQKLGDHDGAPGSVHVRGCKPAKREFLRRHPHK